MAMIRKFLRERGITRRELAAGPALAAPRRCARSAASRRARCSGGSPQAVAPPRELDDRILVVLELSGGNDGLNTLVPYGDDAYYKHRPTIGLKPEGLLRLDDHFGFNPGMVGFERLYQDGKLAIVHGCGYDNPSFSHFTSMAYWHTAAPNSGDEYGWVGRLADAHGAGRRAQLHRQHRRDASRSRSAAATTCRWCSTIPTKFAREGFFEEQAAVRARRRGSRPMATPRARSCSTSPERARRLRAGARGLGRATSPRSTTASSASTCARSRR